MSTRHLEAAGTHPGLRPPVKAVLIAIAHHANYHSGIAWPGNDRLQLFTGFGRRAIQQAVNELENLGLVKIKRGGGLTSNVYTLTIPDVPPIDISGRETLPPDAGVHPRTTCAGPSDTSASDAPPPAHDVHPSRAPRAPEQEMNKKTNESADARVFNEDWQPSAKTVEQLVREGLTHPIIDRERRSFILKAMAGEIPRKPDAAFRVWCNRLGQLKHPIKEPPPPTSKVTIDADYCRKRVEQADFLIQIGGTVRTTVAEARASKSEWQTKLEELTVKAA